MLDLASDNQHRFMYSFDAAKQQAIDWGIVDPVLWRHMGSLGHSELTVILIRITGVRVILGGACTFTNHRRKEAYTLSYSMKSFVVVNNSTVKLLICKYVMSRKTHSGITRSYVSIQITLFVGPTWGPPGSCRPQMGSVLATGVLLSGYERFRVRSLHRINMHMILFCFGMVVLSFFHARCILYIILCIYILFHFSFILPIDGSMCNAFIPLLRQRFVTWSTRNLWLSLVIIGKLQLNYTERKLCDFDIFH